MLGSLFERNIFMLKFYTLERRVDDAWHPVIDLNEAKDALPAVILARRAPNLFRIVHVSGQPLSEPETKVLQFVLTYGGDLVKLLATFAKQRTVSLAA